MSPRLCQVCSENQQKYTCSKCYIAYCSVRCYTEHQQAACTAIPSNRETNDISARDGGLATSSAGSVAVPVQIFSESSASAQSATTSEPLPAESKPLRPLTSLRWPYVPEESAFPDPLKRDDPKDLQLHQYEAIATSPRIREILNKHESLPALLTSIDKLRGIERERALQKALGVTPPDIDDWRKPKEVSEEVLALRELAEAVETSIRGDNDVTLGLNWTKES